VKRVTNSIKHWISNHPFVFPFLAFIIPAAVRTVPEVLMGPFMLGFDTMGFYVPNSLLWLHNGINVWGLLAAAPLFYVIYMSLISAGGPLVLLIKIISPLLLGFLASSMYFFAKRGLNWSAAKSLFVGVLGTVYFVALRASWDQLREELGMVFFFVVLTLILLNQKESSWKRCVALSLAIMAVVLSHQLVSVLMFGVIIVTAAYDLIRKNFAKSISLISVSLPAAFYFVIIYLSGVVQSGVLGYTPNSSPLASWTGFASYQSMLLSEAGLFMYCFLPLLPFVLIGLWRSRNLQLISWLIWSVILLFIPFSSVSPYRWVLLLTYPLVFYATDSLSWLKSIKWKRFKITTYRIALLYVVLSTAIFSFGFIFMNNEKPFIYFNSNLLNSYSNQIPTSMLQNTLPLAGCQSTTQALQWFKDNVNGSAVLLTHTVFYGWALLTLNEHDVINYGFGDPSASAIAVAQEGYTQIYLIWWVTGHGWYGQPSLPSSFREVYQTGEIAIYTYNSSS